MANRAAKSQTEKFDMDTFFDFTQRTTASTSTPVAANAGWNASSFDKPDDRQLFNDPSHAYNLHKQQVSLPVGSIATLPTQTSTGTDNRYDEGSPSNMLSLIACIKKHSEDMDEDERLLASEEGKRLPSKEHRQLRNKVSARAFRSRRKGAFSPPAV